MPVGGIYAVGTARTDAGQAVTSGSVDFSSVLGGSLRRSEEDLDVIFDTASKTYGVPVSLLKAVAKAESNFNPDATSGCGAMGIMQLMPSTARSLGVEDAYDPKQNIMGGAKYLSGLLREFDGNTELAVAAYNAGPGAVHKYGGIPPFQETQNYVAKVMNECGGQTADADLSAAGALSSLGEALFAGAEDGDSLVQLALMSIYQAQMSQLNDGDKIVV